MQAVCFVNGGILWANLHLLFWLSLVPFTTSLDGSDGLRHLAGRGLRRGPFVSSLAAVAFSILVRVLIAHHGKDLALAVAVGRDVKGKVSMLLLRGGDPARVRQFGGRLPAVRAGCDYLAGPGPADREDASRGGLCPRCTGGKLSWVIRNAKTHETGDSDAEAPGVAGSTKYRSGNRSVGGFAAYR